jgi:hypothetical protein
MVRREAVRHGRDAATYLGDGRRDNVELDELEADALIDERLRQLAEPHPLSELLPQFFCRLGVGCEHSPDYLHARSAQPCIRSVPRTVAEHLTHARHHTHTNADTHTV